MSDSDIEWVATGIQDVPSSCKVDVCAVHNEGVALGHVTLQAVESAVLGDLHTSKNAFSNKGLPDDHSSKTKALYTTDTTYRSNYGLISVICSVRLQQGGGCSNKERRDSPAAAE